MMPTCFKQMLSKVAAYTAGSRAAGPRMWPLLSMLLVVLGTTLSGAALHPAHAVPIKVVYTDPAGYGFNDPATSAKRKAAFQGAVNIWAQRLPGKVPIYIKAYFDSTLAGDLNTAVLAVGQPTGLYSGADGLQPDVWYPAALANELTGKDINQAKPGDDPAKSPEITVRFNANVDRADVLAFQNFYYGTDGKAGGDVDFYSVALHEIAHGLGFFSSLNEDGTFQNKQPDIFSTFLTGGPTPNGKHLLDMTAAERKQAIISGSLYFVGPKTKAAVSGGAKLYAPDPFAEGNSIEHLDEATYHGINELMTPIGVATDGSVAHDPGPIAVAMLKDIGWDVGAAVATGPSVSGRVRYQDYKSTSGAAGVTITLYKGATAVQTATTDDNGDYSLDNVAAGDYTIKATKPGMQFTDPQYVLDATHDQTRSLTVKDSDVEINFVPFTNLSGLVTYAGVPVPGGVPLVTFSVAHTIKTFTTDSSGHFGGRVYEDANCVVTPVLPGFTFNPPAQTVSLEKTPPSGVVLNFTATPNATAVSGRVTTNGTKPMAYVRLNADDGKEYSSNSQGYYVLPGLASGTHTITPQQTGSSFVPASRTLTLPSDPSTNINFVGTRLTYTATGRVIDGNKKALSGVKIPWDVMGQTFTAFTGADGTYKVSFSLSGDNPLGGSDAEMTTPTYHISPSLEGYSFTPTNVNGAIKGIITSVPDIIGKPVGWFGNVVVHEKNKTSLSGVYITCKGSDGTTQQGTTKDGDWDFKLQPSSYPTTYTFTAAAEGYTFDPPQTVKLTPTGITPQLKIFTATPVLYKITGTVQDYKHKLYPGIRLVCQGLIGDGSGVYATTTSNGSYTFSLPMGTYHIAPAAPGHNFNPTTSKVIISASGKVDGTTNFIEVDPRGKSIAVAQTPRSANSSVALSTARADAVTNSISLGFLSALDAATAGDATHYSVTINGRAVNVESAGYNSSNHTVTLDLPTASLHSDDHVLVRWHDLQDATGRTLTTATAAVSVR